MKRKPKIVLPAKYILLILTVVCVAAMITSLRSISPGRPLNAVAGYVFVPMRAGSTRSAHGLRRKPTILKI